MLWVYEMLTIGLDMRQGNTAQVFAYGRSRVCKLFYKGLPYEYVRQEYKNARMLFKLGIRVPEAFEIVCLADRYGIIYEKIDGITMREHADKEHAWEEFIAEHKKILNISANSFMPYKEFLIAMIRSGCNGRISEHLQKEIMSLPDGNSLLHGDYHPGNVMITAAGEFVIIDLLNVCCGPKEYDVARTFFLLENEPWQNTYLQEMGYQIADIQSYLEVVRAARNYE